MPDTTLTSAELDELEALAKAATPGPWYQPDDINPELIFSGAPDEPAFLLAEAFREDSDADATYIASANPATILRLLSLARAGLEAGKAEESMREPRAWEGWWSGAGSVDSFTRVTRLRSTMEEWKAEGAEITPLFAIRALPLTGDDKP